MGKDIVRGKKHEGRTKESRKEYERQGGVTLGGTSQVTSMQLNMESAQHFSSYQSKQNKIK